MDNNNWKTKLEEISGMLEMGKELIHEEPILDFQSASREFLGQVEEIMQDGRQLRLGIVGEVKAGKSSFLNALLFEGQDILPKAPTPMTAALTRISYSDVPKARIVFYDKNDWEAVRSNACKYDEKLKSMYDEYTERMDKEKKAGRKLLHRPLQGSGVEHPSREPAGTAGRDASADRDPVMSLAAFEKANRSRIPAEYQACKEIYQMARDNGLDVGRYLGTEQDIRADGDGRSYFSRLNDYVGSDGTYTPIVKYTEIQLDNDLLEGIEVIDTPGMNDPILSRGRTTMKFLMQCDAVFLLGYAGQFLGAEEMQFLMSSLPNEGINKAVLIGSKVDSAILQYPSKRNPTFQRAYLGTIQNCERQAEENIRECTATEHNEKLLRQLKESLPPRCISSLAYGAALKMRRVEKLGPDEQKMVDNYRHRFADFTDDAETLMGLSNIDDVRRDVFEETKSQKAQIIQDRIRSLIPGKIAQFLNILEEISIQAKSNQSDLKKYDCEQLEEKLDKLKQNLDSIRIVVKNMFERSAIESRRLIEDMAVDVGQEMENHMEIEVVHTSKTKHHSSTSGVILKKTEHWEEVIHTHTAEVKDVDDNMRKYMLSCRKMINDTFRNILKIKELQDGVKAVVMGAFEQSDKDFDENKILIPLENALSRISLPTFEIEADAYEEMLDGLLSGIVSNGVVKNDDIPMLKRAQDQVLAKMSKDIVQEIRDKGVEMDQNLQTQAAVFVDHIVNQLSENQKKLEAMIQDKQAGLEKFDAFLSHISDAKQKLRGLEV